MTDQPPPAPHRWDPRPGDADRIREHLDRQRGLDERLHVRLASGQVVPVGADAEGEADECG